MNPARNADARSRRLGLRLNRAWVAAMLSVPALSWAMGLLPVTSVATTTESTAAAPATDLHSERQDTGTGPWVVLQSGLGDGLAPWAQVRRALAGRHPVFSYDRPGYGASPALDAPRSPCDVADELHALLHRLGVPPPYLLVGHSIGGLYQYAFSQRYPDEVAGLVLVDATHPRHWAQVQSQAPAQAALLRGLRATAFSRTERREFDDQLSCTDAWLTQPLHPPRAVVLARGRYELIELGAFERLSQDEAQDWLRLTGAPRVDAVPGSGHYIQREQPAAVVEAIERLLIGLPPGVPAAER